ncbi:putative transcription factor interactor and regulator CCHC(Zn) family [Arabidopsis thaliana]
MLDVGEKSRPPDDPPGDPPDAAGVWVRKVVGSGPGGRLNPVEIMDDAFVTARMVLEFPNGEDGEPVITIGSEVLEVMNTLWKNCMIVKVLGRSLSIAVLSRRLREMWKPKGAMHVLDLPRNFFMIRFEFEDEYLAALTGGPWRAFGSYLMVQAWSPDFDPLRNDIVTTPVWVRLTNIPLNLYYKSVLMGIAKGLGKPIKVDLTTLHFDRARFARICVEVNLAKPLKGTIMINGERYFVAYEGLSNICSFCGLYGHLVHSCPRGAVERTVNLTPTTVAVRTTETVTPRENGSSQDEDGFTPVRRSGKRVENPTRRAGKAAEKASAVMERNLKDIPITDTENIMTPNRFVGLEEDSVADNLREGAMITGENKENEGGSNQARIGKKTCQLRQVPGKSDWRKNTGETSTGFKSKRAETNRPNELLGFRAKQSKQVRPTRGLVEFWEKNERRNRGSGTTWWNIQIKARDMWRNGRGWDLTRIMPYVEDNMRLRLAAVVLDDVTGAKDRLSWGGDPARKFTVQSAYALFTRNPAPRQQVGELFNRLWRTVVLERVKLFMWLAMNQVLMTNVERHRRHLCDSNICPVCKSGQETILHILRDCPAMAGIWQRIFPMRQRRSFFSNTLLEWLYENLGDCREVEGSRWSTIYAMAIWWAWKWRCGDIFDMNKKCRDRVRFVKELAREVTKSHQKLTVTKSGGVRIDRLIAWVPPQEGWLKLNIDGGSHGNPGVATAGGVIRDVNGIWGGGFVVNIGICTAPLAELWGVYYGLFLVWERRARRVELEVDSQIVVGFLTTGISDSHPLSFLVRLCYGFLSKDWIVQVSHVYREANRLADGLANYAFTLPLGFHLFDSAPDCVTPILLEDANGVSRIRNVRL